MKYYWVKNKDSGDNEIIQESEKDRVFNRFFDETNYSLENLKTYYTFICEIEQPNEI